LEFEFDAAMPKVRQLLLADSLGITKTLQSDLKKEGISHFVAQTLSYNRLNIYFYLEDDVVPFKAHDRFKNECNLLIISDPEWKSYELIEEKK
jgi:hypothetical protein